MVDFPFLKLCIRVNINLLKIPAPIALWVSVRFTSSQQLGQAIPDIHVA